MDNMYVFLDMRAQLGMAHDCQQVPQSLYPDLPYFCQVEINADGNCHLSHSQEISISLISVSLWAGLSGKANQEFRWGTAPLASLLCPLTETCQTPRTSLVKQTHPLQKYLEEPGYFHHKRCLHMLVWGKGVCFYDKYYPLSVVIVRINHGFSQQCCRVSK